MIWKGYVFRLSSFGQERSFDQTEKLSIKVWQLNHGKAVNNEVFSQIMCNADDPGHLFLGKNVAINFCPHLKKIATHPMHNDPVLKKTFLYEERSHNDPGRPGLLRCTSNCYGMRKAL